MTWTCPTCSTTNDEAAAVCSVCGGPSLRADAPPTVPVMPIEAADPTVSPGAPVSGADPGTPTSPHGSGSQFGVIAPAHSPPPTPPAGGAGTYAVPEPTAGSPKDSSNGRTAALAVLCTVVVIGLIGAVVILVAKPFDKTKTASQASPGITSTSLTTEPVTTSTSSTTSTTTTTTTTTTAPPPPDPNVAAQATLVSQAAADQPAVDGLLDQWVPQVSSKYVGLNFQGITWHQQDILADYQQMGSKYPVPGVGLLWSPNYSTFRTAPAGGGFWVSIALQGYPTPDGANQWCDSMGIDADNCFAKLLSHTHPPAGAFVGRK